MTFWNKMEWENILRNVIKSVDNIFYRVYYKRWSETKTTKIGYFFALF